MTLTRTRMLAFGGISIGALLAMLMLTAAHDASAGKGGPRCFGRPATVSGVVGTNGDDIIVGTSGPDQIDGKGGNDKICGRKGADELLGGPGDDSIRGGSNRDYIDGENGDDRIFGNGGNDGRQLARAAARGRSLGLFGGPGNDVIGGGSGDDELYGEDGTDVHKGAVGFDFCTDQDADSVFRSCEFVPNND